MLIQDPERSDFHLETYVEHWNPTEHPLMITKDRALIIIEYAAESMILMGDFDGWTEGIAMHHHHGRWWGWLPLGHGKDCYKLLADGVWMLDPNNPYISFGPEANNNTIPQKGRGVIVELPAVYSPQLDNERSLFVYLSPAARKGVPCVVLYGQDGFNLFENPRAPFGHWNLDGALDALIAQDKLPPIIVVGVDTQDRMNEYSWAHFDHEQMHTPKLELYTRFLMETVHPLICTRWNCCGDVGILGGSLGGSSALWMAWQYPEFFSKVAAFSGSFWMTQPSMKELIQEVDIPPTLRIYLDSGDRDHDDVIRYEADNLSFVDMVHRALCEKGWESAAPMANDLPFEEKSFFYWDPEQEIPNGELCMIVGHGHKHNEQGWAERVSWALCFLYVNCDVTGLKSILKT